MLRVQSRRRAFTLIELIIVMGLIAIVAGLMLPALGAARKQAQDTVQLKQIQQCGGLIAVFAADRADVYPLASAWQFQSSRFWFAPLLRHGYVKSLHEIDPQSKSRGMDVAFAMSVSMTCDPSYYVPEREEYPKLLSERPTRLIRQADVSFPSSKGLLFTYRPGFVQTSRPVLWCCMPERIPAPVLFADGSAEVIAHQDCKLIAPLRPHMHAGQPVITTWYGVRGVDR